MKNNITPPRLGSYITFGLGAGLLGSSSASAATTALLYGTGAQSPATTPATPAGISIGLNGPFGYANKVSGAYTARFGFGGGKYFTQGANLVINSWGLGQYSNYGSAMNGAVFNSNQNYASISFNGEDGVYEAVGQFYLTGNGTGYLFGLAKNSDNSALSISAGKLAISAIPEPSSIVLLSLGAAGVLARRRRAA